MRVQYVLIYHLMYGTVLLVSDELGGQPLLELLQKFYWNITDFDGAGQLDSFNLQDILHEVPPTCKGIYNVKYYGGRDGRMFSGEK